MDQYRSLTSKLSRSPPGGSALYFSGFPGFRVFNPGFIISAKAPNASVNRDSALSAMDILFSRANLHLGHLFMVLVLATLPAFTKCGENVIVETGLISAYSICYCKINLFRQNYTTEL